MQNKSWVLLLSLFLVSVISGCWADQVKRDGSSEKIEENNASIQAHVEQPLIGPSFPCEKAQTEVEKMICADKELSALDAELAQAYRAAMDVSTNKSLFQKQHQAWLQKLRDTCEDTACLKRVYKQWIGILTQIIKASKSEPVYDNSLGHYRVTRTQFVSGFGMDWAPASDPTVCEAVAKNVNAYIEKNHAQPSLCEVPISAGNGFELPVWTELDRKQIDEVLPSIIEYKRTAFPGDKHRLEQAAASQNISVDELLKKYTDKERQRFNSHNEAIYESTRFDFGGGNEHEIIRTVTGKTIFSCGAKTKDGFSQFKSPSYYVIIGSELDYKKTRSFNVNKGYLFQYKNSNYTMRWGQLPSDERGQVRHTDSMSKLGRPQYLTVHEITDLKHNQLYSLSVRPICELSYQQ